MKAKDSEDQGYVASFKVNLGYTRAASKSSFLVVDFTKCTGVGTLSAGATSQRGRSSTAVVTDSCWAWNSGPLLEEYLLLTLSVDFKGRVAVYTGV